MVALLVFAGLLSCIGWTEAVAPHWWEEPGTTIRGIWPKCALGDGLSSMGQMDGLPAFMALLDRLHAANVSTLQMVVYDSGDGYRPEDLWCGLAGSNYSKPLSNIGSEADWLTFVDAAHARNMTITSFWNAAYFWTGSPYFKQAEADIRAHGLEGLPGDSPALWFRWSAQRSRFVKPPDHQPAPNWVGDWVWDPDVNASYFSVWGSQPTTDYASESWRVEMIRILTRWVVDLKLDGWMFDAPDGYLGAGNDGVGHSAYHPELIRQSITDVIRNVSDQRAAAFAEIYSDPPLMADFGFDGEFADDKTCPQHSGKYCPPNQRSAAIGQGILSANASLIESAMSGPGSVDDLSSQMLHQPGTSFRSSYLKDLPVSVSWLPNTTIASDFGSDNLNCTLGAGATFAIDYQQPMKLSECFSHCRSHEQCDAIRVDWFTLPRNWTTPRVGCGLRGGVNVSQCAVQHPQSDRAHTVRYTTFAVDAPELSQLVVATTALAGYLPIIRNSGNDWGMSAAPWPGEEGGNLPMLLTAMRGEAALGLKALRLQIPTGSEAHYSMLRYDALGTGRVAIIILNLGQHAAAEIQLDELPKLLGQQPVDLQCKMCPIPKLATRMSINVEAYSYIVLAGLRLPSWSLQGALNNCTGKYAPEPVVEMPVTNCLMACLRDVRCDAVIVEWILPQQWPRPAQMMWYGNRVRCQLRGGLDLATCANSSAHSTLTLASVSI